MFFNTHASSGHVKHRYTCRGGGARKTRQWDCRAPPMLLCVACQAHTSALRGHLERKLTRRQQWPRSRTVASQHSPASVPSHTPDQLPFHSARRRRLRLSPLFPFFSHWVVFGLGSGWQVTTSRCSSSRVGECLLLCVTVGWAWGWGCVVCGAVPTLRSPVISSISRMTGQGSREQLLFVFSAPVEVLACNTNAFPNPIP